jgi:OOP family OmpA-OmpF porin
MNTQKLPRFLLPVVAVLAMLAAMPLFAADGDKSELRGLITAIRGDTITIRDANNAESSFTVNADTEYRMTKGLTGAIHEKVEQSALLPGLPLKVDVVAQGDGFVATDVSFKADDHRTAQQVQAGLAPTTERIDNFGEYEALETVEVHFASGKADISAEDQAELRAFADKAKATDGYMIVLQGFTDSTGDAAANQRLSTRRATAVGNFLQQQGGLMPGRVTAADGMGIAADAGTGSNAGARKVVVKLVVDKGQAAGN